MDRIDDSDETTADPHTVRTGPGSPRPIFSYVKPNADFSLALEYEGGIVVAASDLIPPRPLVPARYALPNGAPSQDNTRNGFTVFVSTQHVMSPPNSVNSAPFLDAIVKPDVAFTLPPGPPPSRAGLMVLPSTPATLPPSLLSAVQASTVVLAPPLLPSPAPVEVLGQAMLPVRAAQTQALGPVDRAVFTAPLTQPVPALPQLKLETPLAPLRVDATRTPFDVAAKPVAGEDRSASLTVRRVAKFIRLAAGAWLGAVLILLVVFRFVDPPVSSRIVQQRLAGQDIIQDWVSLENISPQIIRAVLLSEDGRFCQHWGVDFDEMQAAFDRAKDGVPRGASTISMQVIKNLFLWPSKSYLRKAIEIPLTFAMELVWPKRRIMEVYLNIAEWGPGIFGVEAASQFHFNKGASRLNEREATQLAVALPNPYTRDAGDPGPRTQRLAEDIQARMRRSSPGDTACVTRANKGR